MFAIRERKHLNTIDVLLAIALFLSIATKLRFGDYSFGPSELLLIIFMLLVGVKLLGMPGYRSILEENGCYIYFWSVLYICLGVGVFINYFLLDGITENSIHSALGYAYAGVVSLVIYSYFRIEKGSLNRVSHYFIVISIPFISFAYFIETAIQHFGLSNDWYSYLLINSYHDGARFSAWSKNPNQLALLFSILPFLILRTLHRKSYFLVFIAIAATIWMGWHIRSDAMSSAWQLVAILLVVTYLYQLARRNNQLHLLIYPALLLVVSIFFYMQADKIFKKPGKPEYFMSGIFYTTLLSGVKSSIDNTVKDEYILKSEGKSELKKNIKENARKNKSNGRDKKSSGERKSNVRLTLFLNSINAFKYSPIVGLGPGAHSGLEAPFEGMEAHNSFLDLLTNAGALGVISFSLLIMLVTYSIAMNKDIYGFMSLISLLIFSSAHLMLRHPLFWFVLVILLTSIDNKQKLNQ